MKTLKQEEIYCQEYRNFEELSAHLEEFLETYYNGRRLHSALGYRTPEEFERDAAAATEAGAAAATMSYFRPPAAVTGSQESSLPNGEGTPQ